MSRTFQVSAKSSHSAPRYASETGTAIWWILHFYFENFVQPAPLRSLLSSLFSPTSFLDGVFNARLATQNLGRGCTGQRSEFAVSYGPKRFWRLNTKCGRMPRPSRQLNVLRTPGNFWSNATTFEPTTYVACWTSWTFPILHPDRTSTGGS